MRKASSSTLIQKIENCERLELLDPQKPINNVAFMDFKNHYEIFLQSGTVQHPTYTMLTALRNSIKVQSINLMASSNKLLIQNLKQWRQIVMDRYFSSQVCKKLRQLLLSKDKNIRLVASHILQYFCVSSVTFRLIRSQRMHYIISICLEQDSQKAQIKEKYNVNYSLL